MPFIVFERQGTPARLTRLTGVAQTLLDVIEGIDRYVPANSRSERTFEVNDQTTQQTICFVHFMRRRSRRGRGAERWFGVTGAAIDQWQHLLNPPPRDPEEEIPNELRIGVVGPKRPAKKRSRYEHLLENVGRAKKAPVSRG